MPNNNAASTNIDGDQVDVVTLDDQLDSINLEDVILANEKKVEDTPVDIPDLGVDPEPKEDDKDESAKDDEPAKDDSPAKDDDSKDDDSEDDGDEETPGAIQSLFNVLGLDDLKAEEYPDTFEGFVDAAKVSTEKMSEKAVQKALSINPTVKELYDFVQNGGEPSAFLQATYPADDFSKVELTDDNTPLQEYVITAELKQRGLSTEDIRDEITDHKEAGSLRRWADRSLKTLQVGQEAAKVKLVEEQSAYAVEERQKVVDYWTGVKDSLTKNNEFIGVTIPESAKDELFEYMSVPVEGDEQDRTQLLIDSENMSPAEEIAIYYMVKNRGRLAELLLRKAKTQVAEGFSDALRKGDGPLRPRGQTSSDPQSAEEIDNALDTLDILTLG